MAVVKIDSKGRITIPRQVRKAAHLRPNQPLNLRLAEDSIVLKKIHTEKSKFEEDPLFKDLRNPAHVDPKKIKKLDLEALEEELWSQ